MRVGWLGWKLAPSGRGMRDARCTSAQKVHDIKQLRDRYELGIDR